MLASELIGRTARDASGRPIGKVADLITRVDERGRPRVVAALITPGHRGRLLGYERPGIRLPKALEFLALALHRGAREVPWEELRF
ncbi:PRC-barrel domain-containing protein [Actinosynnema sp.]|uniref:PRC-barrel domain-containing protein n=1 Tax=Actinosynnema sp. TaxID=1872144 RepID=UPI003F847D62